MTSELRQRLRGRRWWLVLGLWFVVLFLLLAFTRAVANDFPDDLRLGAFMFGSLALFVLSLACLVVPSLTAGTINGERQNGTMAVLQATLLRPWEIVGAKLGAAVVTAAAFLAATLPLALWCVADGGVDLGSAAVTYLLLLVTSVVLAAIGLAASATIRRAALAAVASYAVVFALAIGSPVLFGLSFVGSEGEVGWRWVLLAPNPLVVLADAVPPPGRGDRGDFGDPLSGLGSSLRALRAPDDPAAESDLAPRSAAPPLWPTGLGLQLVLAAGALLLAAAGLRVPARHLAAGERVA